MARRNGTTEYDKTQFSVSADEDFVLEDILSEYGGGHEQRLTKEVEMPAAEDSLQRRKASGMTEQSHEEPKFLPAEEESIPAPKPITLEEVVGSTVDAVMEENKELFVKPKRGLFSRRKLEETEQLPPRVPPEPEPEPEPEVMEPEPDPHEAATKYRLRYQTGKNAIIPATLMALVPTVLLIAEQWGDVMIPMWTGDLRFQGIVLLACLAITFVLCRQVVFVAIERLQNRRCTAEALAVLAVLVSAVDCVICLMPVTRSAVTSYSGVAALTMVVAQWGLFFENRGMLDTFRTVELDAEPPYLVTDTDRGACKQRGMISGFYTVLRKDDSAKLWQTALLPVVAAASVVFAGLSSAGQGRGGDFFLNWSAILSASTTFSLPLTFSLPWAKLTRHLHKAGCAVAGYAGAELISRRRAIIVADADLFPPGTIQLNGVKVFGEEMRIAISHAATLAREAGSGLERLFDGLLRSEQGTYEKLDDFSFYEEGGWSGTVRGESLLMGTAPFMRKMDVRLPGNINLKTGIFLAVDRQLVAVFAVKYNAAENVDYALRVIRQNHILPILASRDPNITPALLQRKFHKGVRVQFPNMINRVALSEAEQDCGMPRALLLREGLLPYAETVVGSRRLCQAVGRGVRLSLAGSIIGTLLVFYLTFLGAYSLLSPLMLELFLLLWTLPVLLLADWTGRY